MNFLKIFLISTIVFKSSFGGSPTFCETLSKDFITLYQTCEFIVDDIVSFFKHISTTSPIMSNGLDRSLNCKLDWIHALFSNGTSRLTGSYLNVVEEILYGHISPPFPAPFDCIQEFLISFQDKLNSARNTDIKGHFVKTAPSNSSCMDLQMVVMTYYEQLTKPKIFDFLGYVNTFEDISMIDLYENYINSQTTCDIEAIAVGIADMVNGNQEESIAYVDGSILELSYPLDCVRTIIELSSNLINSTYAQILTTVQNSQDPSSVCESFAGEVAIIKAGVFDMFNRIANYTLYNSFEYPELIPAYTSDSSCKVYNILYDISQALSLCTNIEWYVILEVLLGYSSPPFEEPLNCICADLMAIQLRADYLMFDFSASLARSIVPYSEFDNTTCDGIRAGLTSYNDAIYKFIDDTVTEVFVEAKAFESYGILDAYVNNIQNNRYCEINGLSIIFSTLLNGDYQESFEIFDEATPADYPYSCVYDMMLQVANYTNSFYENLVANFTGQTTAFP